MKTILFFTAGSSLDEDETAALASLTALANPAYRVRVLNGSVPASYGDRVLDGDFVAGTVPDSYKDDGDPIYPEFDLENPPRPETLPANQAVVNDGDVLDVTGGGTISITVDDGEITGVAYTAP